MTGTEAINRMRRLLLLPGESFAMRFITCDLSRDEYGEIRVYERCQIRTARRNEGLQVNSDHYLFFTDLENDKFRQCFKWLIRAVAFPPSYTWYEVKWFE